MKYTIGINQLALFNTSLDLSDCALLDYLYFYCSTPNKKIDDQRIIDDLGQKWTWIDYGTIITDMPLLRITAPSGISRKLQKLNYEGFIQTRLWEGKKTLVLLTAKTDQLFLSDSEFQKQNSRLAKIEFQNSKYASNNTTTINKYTDKENNTNTQASEAKSEPLSSKNSLTPCTPQELWEIAVSLNISLGSVKDTHERMVELIEDGVFQKKYGHKTVYKTLVRWMKNSLQMGKIRELDEVGKLNLQTQNPEERAKMAEVYQRLEKEGKI